MGTLLGAVLMKTQVKGFDPQSPYFKLDVCLHLIEKKSKECKVRIDKLNSSLYKMKKLDRLKESISSPSQEFHNLLLELEEEIRNSVITEFKLLSLRLEVVNKRRDLEILLEKRDIIESTEKYLGSSNTSGTKALLESSRIANEEINRFISEISYTSNEVLNYEKDKDQALLELNS